MSVFGLDTCCTRLTEGEIVAIGGKTLRGTYTPNDRFSTIHMLSPSASS
ncbi:hypothetical protein [Yersinia intermedia]|nr:hypothetical protein [Yersinia intermedia]EEQ16972.1 Transposase, IS4 family [Yersinia intermedia ATCC 29909]